MKILFVGVFDTDRRSTNTSQLLSFKRLGHEVVGYNYRQRAQLIGRRERDLHLYGTIQKGNFDLVVFSKCNGVSLELFKMAKTHSKTCLWFMDPLQTYDKEMRLKTQLVDYFCCDKVNVLSVAKEFNKNSFHVCEGYDEDVDKPHLVEKEYDISFIGNVYGNRATMLRAVDRKVNVINNAFGNKHSLEVSKSRINLNFCTDAGASDRVYKIMAAGGLLLSNDWEGRKEHFTNGRECVIFEDIKDLNEKIEYYLENPEMANQIAKYGQEAVKAFSRSSWATRIVELSFDC
tara:strand:+ start:239 stop:1105 length:867 start_codon:yes stop_codon:yes gene_type:complete